MKIGITGHTAGIGKSLYSLLSNDHTVTGFALENGYDITNSESIDRIVSESEDFDCFINNAWAPFGQTTLLKKMYEVWQGQDKTIVNIGSWITQLDSNLTASHPEWPSGSENYILDKNDQDLFVNSNIHTWQPRIIHCLPGTVNTPGAHWTNDPNTMQPESVAQLIVEMLQWVSRGIYVQQIIFTAKS